MNHGSLALFSVVKRKKTKAGSFVRGNLETFSRDGQGRLSNSTVIQGCAKLEDEDLSGYQKIKVNKILSDFNEKFEKFSRLNSDDVDIKKQTEYCIETLASLGKNLGFFRVTFEKICSFLEFFKDNSEFKSSNSEKVRKIGLKLKVLSEENIALHKECETLKSEIKVLQKTVVYDQIHYSIEKLLRDLTNKNDVIAKYSKEINEFKAREIMLYRKIEEKNRLLHSYSIAFDDDDIKDDVLQYRNASKKYLTQIPHLPLK